MNTQNKMKTQTEKILIGLAALAATGITAQSQYTLTTLNDPANVNETFAIAISGTNIVGYYYLSNGSDRGFLYNGSAWTTLIAPGAGSGNNQGTQPNRVSGANIVGNYVDSGTVSHGFIYNILTRTWAILNDPLAGAASLMAQAQGPKSGPWGAYGA